MAFDYAIFSVYRYAGEVAHMLLRAGKLIKECCFAAVLISHQGKGKKGILRQGVTASFGMEPSLLAQAGVGGMFFLFPLRLLLS